MAARRRRRRSTTSACASERFARAPTARCSPSSRARAAGVRQAGAPRLIGRASSRSAPRRSSRDALDERFAHDALAIVEAMAARRRGRVRRARRARARTRSRRRRRSPPSPARSCFAGEWYDYAGEVRARRHGADDPRAASPRARARARPALAVRGLRAPPAARASRASTSSSTASACWSTS